MCLYSCSALSVLIIFFSLKPRGGGGDGLAIDLETIVRATQKFWFQNWTLTVHSEKMVNFIPLKCISTTKNNPLHSAPINFFLLGQLQGDEQNSS